MVSAETAGKNVCGECRYFVRRITPRDFADEKDLLTTGECSYPGSLLAKETILAELSAEDNFSIKKESAPFILLKNGTLNCFSSR